MAITFEKQGFSIKKYSTWIVVGIVAIILIFVLFNFKTDISSQKSTSSAFLTPTLTKINIDFDFLESEQIKQLEPFISVPSFSETYGETVTPGRANPFSPPTEFSSPSQED